MRAISVAINSSGTLDVAPFIPSSSSSSEFVIIPWVSKFRVHAIVSVIVTGAGTPDVAIRVSFQQNIQYLEFDPIRGVYDIQVDRQGHHSFLFHRRAAARSVMKRLREIGLWVGMTALVAWLVVLCIQVMPKPRAPVYTVPRLLKPAPAPVRAPLDPQTDQKYTSDINDGLWAPVQVHPRKPRLTFVLLGEDGKLTSQAIEYAGLHPSQVKPVQLIIDAAFSEMTQLTRSHAQEDPLRTNPEAAIFAYRIEPFPQEGRAVREALKEKLNTAIGPERASRLLESFLWTKYFGAFGEGEVLVTFRHTPELAVEWQLRNPETGKLARSSSGPYHAWTEDFGDVFQLEP